MEQIDVRYNDESELESISLIGSESSIFIGYVEIPRKDMTIKEYNELYYKYAENLIDILHPEYVPQTYPYSSIKIVKPIKTIENNVLLERLDELIDILKIDIDDVLENDPRWNGLSKEELLLKRYRYGNPFKILDSKLNKLMSFRDIVNYLWDNSYDLIFKENPHNLSLEIYLIETLYKKFFNESLEVVLNEIKLGLKEDD